MELVLKEIVKLDESNSVDKQPVLARVKQALAVWHQRITTRHHLRDLDPHLLSDVGITAQAVTREINKPFWRA